MSSARSFCHVVPDSSPHEYSRDYVWSESILPLRDRSGEVIALAHALADVTAQTRARERLALVNEASTGIGNTLEPLRTVRELTNIAVPRFADFAYVNLLDTVFSGQEPLSRQQPEVMVLRRAAHRSVLEPEACDEGRAEPVAVGDIDAFGTLVGSPFTGALRDGEPVLLNGEELRATLRTVEPGRAALAQELAVHSWLLVPLFARGTALSTAVFARFRDPRRFEADDVLLAQEIVGRAAVCVDNASRYSRERTTALTLQRSLLPQRLASTPAVDAVSRYLPASGHTGLGGDWFDVLPLSGARVALVVGDVVGHDLQSAVTMGRLRTAVRALADLDLPPDQLLAHLDRQVRRFVDERGGDEGLQVSETLGDMSVRNLRPRLAPLCHGPGGSPSACGVVGGRQGRLRRPAGWSSSGPGRCRLRVVRDPALGRGHVGAVHRWPGRVAGPEPRCGDGPAWRSTLPDIAGGRPGGNL